MAMNYDLQQLAMPGCWFARHQGELTALPFTLASSFLPGNLPLYLSNPESQILHFGGAEHKTQNIKTPLNNECTCLKPEAAAAILPDVPSLK